MTKHNPTKRILSDEQIYEAYNLYNNQDTTLKQIAQLYEIKSRTLRNYFRQINAGTFKDISITHNSIENDPNFEEKMKLIRQEFEEGKPIHRIADKYGIAYSTLYRRLKW